MQVDARSGRVAELVAKQAAQRNFLHLPSPAGQGGGEGAAGDSSQPPQPPLLLVQAILNPLSKPAQRLAPLLAFLRDALGAETQLVLNPQASLVGRNAMHAVPWRVSRLHWLHSACPHKSGYLAAHPPCLPACPCPVLLLQTVTEDMPLKTFYRYALPSPTHGAGAEAGPPPPAAATFQGLPPDKVLTLGMDEPEPW